MVWIVYERKYIHRITKKNLKSNYITHVSYLFVVNHTYLKKISQNLTELTLIVPCEFKIFNQETIPQKVIKCLKLGEKVLLWIEEGIT